MLSEECERIALHANQPVAVPDLELVVRSFSDTRHEDFPYTGSEKLPHRVPATIPLVEVSDDRDPLGIRRPNVEGGPGDSVDLNDVSSQLLVQFPVLSLAKEVQVERTENGRKRIRIALDPQMTIVRGKLEFVRDPVCYSLERRLEESVRMHLHRRPDVSWIFEAAHRHRSRVRAENADDQLLARLMQAEHGKRITMPGFENRMECTVIDRRERIRKLHRPSMQSVTSRDAKH